MAPRWLRRKFLQTSAAGMLSTAFHSGRPVLGADISRQTFTYKSFGNCQINADIYNAAPASRRPIAVWLHGGALIMGNRRGIDKTLLTMLIKADYVVISIDYRLAPETKLPAILEDVRDAFAWIRKEAPRSFTRNVDSIVVLGGSAGGYLTLTCGYLIEPRPAALVSFWGYGDIAGNWYSRPDPFYRRQPLVSESLARASVGKTAIAEPPPKDQRFRFYLYCRQNGLWPKEVAGHDPDADPHAFDRLCPIRNVFANYPPTMLIHGTSDTDVPHEQSVFMDRELARQNVEHELILIPKGSHGLGNIGKEEVCAAVPARGGFSEAPHHLIRAMRLTRSRRPRQRRLLGLDDGNAVESEGVELATRARRSRPAAHRPPTCLMCSAAGPGNGVVNTRRPPPRTGLLGMNWLLVVSYHWTSKSPSAPFKSIQNSPSPPSW